MPLGTRRGENLLPLFLNAVLCEFNVQKRCQTNNPEEQNGLFSKQLAELSRVYLQSGTAAVTTQPQPGGGRRAHPELAGQPGLQYAREHRRAQAARVSFRNLGTNPYSSLSPCLTRASTFTMLRCLTTLTCSLQRHRYT